MKKISFLFFIFFVFSFVLVSFAQTSSKVKISGKVRDHQNKVMPYVNVFFKDSFEGDVSDSTGYFEFTTTQTGERLLTAMFMGYETWEQNILLKAGEDFSITIKMEMTYIETEGTTVSASAFTSGDEKGVTLRSMDVVTTPGAAADIYLAIQTYPGVSKLDEGSGLFVRGGDVSETVTILDQATVIHPYRWESPTGGVFGTIAPFLVRGTFFSSGGFSAKYGNALSAVLAMESLGLPNQTFYNFNVGLAGVSAGATNVLIPGKLGIRFTGNYIATDIMFRLNQSKEEFSVLPNSQDGNLGLIYKYSDSGQLKFFAFGSRDEVGVKVDQPSFDAVFDGSGVNQLYNIQWSDLFRENWLAKTSLSLNRFTSDMAFGVLDLNQRDDTYKLRTDHEIEAFNNININFGGEIEYTINNFKGRVPAYELLLDPNSDFYQLDDKFGARRIGFYSEYVQRLKRNLALNVGARTDHHNLSDQMVFDPRASLLYSITQNSNIRLSWGIFHQFATPISYAPGPGNPDLQAMQAQHVIAGFDYQKPKFQFRIEAYYKDYDDLLVEDINVGYLNEGYGFAKGLDLFFKYGELFQDPVNGWISYSIINSKRYQAQKTATTNPNNEVYDFYEYDYAPSSFDVSHNLTLVTKVNINPQFNFGFTYRIATGRPITPVIGSIQDPIFNYYHPIEGQINSERLPTYHRFDTSATYYFPLRGSDYLVVYAGLSNITNQKNVLDYDYSADYSSRKPRTTNFSRFIYVGFTVAFQSLNPF